MRACWSFRLCASPCWTRRRVGTKRNESLINITWHPQTKTKDQDSDRDSDNERFCNTSNNWPRFLAVESSSDDLPPSKLSPFAVQICWMPNIFNLAFFLERPLRTSESNVRSSGGPGSVSTGTQASSGKSGTVSADARVPCESAKPIPPKGPLGVSPNPHKMASKGSAAPSNSAPKGLAAGPLKTAASKDDSSPSRRSPTKVRV